MSKSKSFVCAAVLLIVVGGVGYLQFRQYRLPIAVEDRASGAIVIEALAQEGAIPAIEEPVFESVASADMYLRNDGLGTLVTSRGRARFYPYQILVWHEAVNDSFAGDDLLITYAPLTFTSAVYERDLQDEPAVFDVSGKVADSNTLLMDRATKSLWSQATGKAIEGSLTGMELQRVVSWTISWTTFKNLYPAGEVLSRETGVERDYTQDPYESLGYTDSADIWFPLSREDGRLPAKQLVVGVPGGSTVYPLEGPFGSVIVSPQGARVNILWDEDLEAPQGFEEDSAGKRIEVPLLHAYWFYWATMNPDVSVPTLP